jgi:hypothetical protein
VFGEEHHLSVVVISNILHERLMPVCDNTFEPVFKAFFLRYFLKHCVKIGIKGSSFLRAKIQDIS